MADVHADGQLNVILRACLSPTWRSIWLSLQIPIYSFESLGLDVQMTDDRLWEFCQRESLILFTNNRNESDETSLGRVIKERGTAASLPVLTPGDAKRLRTDRAYAEKAAERMIDILIDIDLYRGTGRLYLPEQA